jgi:hypothetical protein
VHSRLTVAKLVFVSLNQETAISSLRARYTLPRIRTEPATKATETLTKHVTHVSSPSRGSLNNQVLIFSLRLQAAKGRQIDFKHLLGPDLGP